MAKLKATAWRRPVSTEQAASTQATLSRDPSADAAHFNRPLPENWKAVPNATSMDEAVGARALTEYETWNYQWLRRKTLGRNTIGQSELSGATGELRLRATNAFMQAAGTGRKYNELSPAEKAMVQNYFLEHLTRALSKDEYTAVKAEDASKIDELIALTAVEIKHEV